MKKYSPVLLFILSIVFLLPGITQPLITIKATVKKQEMVELAAQSMFVSNQPGNFIEKMLQSTIKKLQIEGSITVFETTRSLLETMNHLIINNHIVVGLLIGIFGVIIPLIKIVLTLLALTLKSDKVKNNLLKWSSVLGKWSMSDVFVMAILVVFLTVNANEQAVKAIEMHARLESGFYYFMAYCLLAIAAGQLMQYQSNKPE
jgi:hypothetical protein